MGNDSLLQRFSHVVDGSMQKGFYRSGLWIGRNPWKSVAGSVLLVVVCCSGFARWTPENRQEKLWVPQDSQAQADATYVESVFGRPVRNGQIILENKKQGGNVLTAEFMQEFFGLWESIWTLKAEYKGKEVTMRDVCFKPGGDLPVLPTQGCSMSSVLDLFNYTSADVPTTDQAVLDLVNQPNPTTVSGRALALSFALGGIRKENGKIVSAEAASFSFQLEDEVVVADGDATSPEAEAWEEKFLALALDESAFTYLSTAAFAQRSFSDEFGGAIGGDISLLSSGYMLIIAYTAIMLGRCNWVESRAGVAMFGILAVGLAIGMSFGLSAALGAFYGPVHSVLPFLLLGLGVDDMFVITNAMQLETVVLRKKLANVGAHERVAVTFATALSHAGVSITITSFTDFVAFLIGSTTALPALSSFCVYAAVGILCVFGLQVTFFGAWLVLDSRRVERGGVDCCPCLCKPRKVEDADCTCCGSSSGAEDNRARDDVDEAKSAGPTERAVEDLEEMKQADHAKHDEEEREETEKYSAFGRFFLNTMGPFLMRKPVKAAVIFITVATAASGIAAASQLEADFDQTSFLPDDSYLQRFVAWQEQYFGNDPQTSPVDVYMRPAAIKGNDEVILGLQDAVAAYSYINKDSIRSFYTMFKAWLPTSQYAGALEADGLPATEADVVAALKQYLESSEKAKAFQSDVVFEKDGTAVKACRFAANFEGTDKASRQVEAMDGIRAVVQDADKGGVLNAFPYSFAFINWEQYKIVGEELFRNVGSSLAAITAIVLILLAHPGTAIIVASCVSLAIIDLLGVMYVWSVAVDAVAVINLVLALGLAIDYSVHIAHTFMIVKGTRERRAIIALADIGGSVLNGATSTMLAVLLLAASQSYVFRVFFKMFFGIVLLGVYHGMIFLPVVLSLCGPEPFTTLPGGASSSEVEISSMKGSRKASVVPNPSGASRAKEDV